jgi:hypothetical protein
MRRRLYFNSAEHFSVAAGRYQQHRVGKFVDCQDMVRSGNVLWTNIRIVGISKDKSMSWKTSCPGNFGRGAGISGTISLLGGDPSKQQKERGPAFTSALADTN